MKKIDLIPFLLEISTIAYGSTLESLPPNSPAFFLLKEYCSKFTNTSLNDIAPFVEFIELIPNTELQFAVATLKSNDEGELSSTNSAFGILQALYTELQPKENKTLVLTKLNSEDCSICYGSKVEHFYEICGFGVCDKCLKTAGAHCPACRLWHRFTYKVEFYQLDKSHYPFVAVLPPPEKPDFIKILKKVYSSLVAWTDLVEPFSEHSSVVAWVGNLFQQIYPKKGKLKLNAEQTKATIKILQIFDILRHRSLWEFKEPLFILHSSVSILRNMLSKADPNRVERSFMPNKHTEEIEVMKQTFSEMENSVFELFYYIQWFINIFIRQCHHVSNEPVTYEEKQFDILENFVKEFEL